MTADPSPEPVETAPEADEGRSGAWRRALALFAVALGTAVVEPMLVVAVPFLVLATLGGVRGGKAFVATLLAMIVLVAGVRDGTWFMERAWTVLVGGAFAAACFWRPEWRLTSRMLVAVAGATGVTAGVLALRSDGWATVDWAFTDQLMAVATTWIDILTLAQGEPVSAALAGAIYRTVEMQIEVFPALIALESMAGLGVAWWLWVRIVRGRDDGIAPVGGFRFNDHLVWILVAALGLVVLRSGDVVTRIGANLAVFMGALYALRGIGVVLFVSGGLSLLGYTLFAVGFLFAAPVVIGFTVLFGIADTWLDLRERMGTAAS